MKRKYEAPVVEVIAFDVGESISDLGGNAGTGSSYGDEA